MHANAIIFYPLVPIQDASLPSPNPPPFMKCSTKSALPRAITQLARTLGVLIPLLAVPALSWAQATTGFNQTALGTYDYDDSANWVGGTINGLWDASLTLEAAQTITFDSNLSLGTGLTFNYTGAFNETLRSDGVADRTVNLGGDILVNTASANRTVTIGSTTANQKLNLDLGGAVRTFDVRATVGTSNQRSLTLINNISNGGLILQGGGNINLSAGTSTSTASLTSLTLKNAHLNANAFSDVAISGALNIDGVGGLNGAGNTGGIAIVTMASTGTRNHTLTADSLVRQNNGVVLFRGTNLGANAPGTLNTSNITFTTAPSAQLVGGGGAAGSKNISILPWAIGGTTAAAAGDTFVTYDAVNGIRPLDIVTEFANTIADGVVSDNNVRLLAGSGTTTINGSATVNSLYLVGDNTTATVLGGTGTLTVTSGAVFISVANTTTAITANLNFGSAQGVIGYGTGKPSSFTGAIAGQNGLVLYQTNSYPSSGSGGTGVTISGNAANSTYTGDTYVLGRATVGVNGVLPSGSRTGNVYVQGYLEFAGSQTINGLNGSGTVTKGSGTHTISLGDNNANGNFTGTISSNMTLAKIGTGTQSFGGANTYTGGTQVNNGTLLITNTSGSGTGTGAVTIASGARFGGTGTASGAVTASAADSVIIAGGVNSVGTLNLTGGLTGAAGATFAYDVNGASVDAVNFGSAALNLDGTVTFDFTSLGTVQTGSAYSLFTGSGDWSSVSASFVFNGPAGYALDTSYGSGAGYIFDALSHSLTVQFVSTAIPEPSSYAALAGCAGLLIVSARRLRTRRA